MLPYRHRRRNPFPRPPPAGFTGPPNAGAPRSAKPPIIPPGC